MDENRQKEFLEFIEEARKSETNYKKFQISETIPQKLAEAIKEIMGVDVSDYGNEICEFIVRHVEKRHGKNGVADHSMSNMDRLSRITDFLDNYDDVVKGKASKYFRKSDGTPADSIEIIMNFNDGKGHLIEAIPTTSRKNLEVCSMYYNKKIEDTVQVPNDEIPRLDVRNGVAISKSSDFNIESSDEKVNRKICKDLKSNGFQPTQSLVSKIQELNRLSGSENSIRDVHTIYSGLKNPDIQKLVTEIAEECKQQERAKEQVPDR